MLDNSRTLHPAARAHQKDRVAVVSDEPVAENRRGVVEDMSGPDGTTRHTSVMETEDKTGSSGNGVQVRA
ncbi:hypothetical protein GCM10025792_53680 [Pseudonocardia tropica]